MTWLAGRDSEAGRDHGSSAPGRAAGTPTMACAERLLELATLERSEILSVVDRLLGESPSEKLGDDVVTSTYQCAEQTQPSPSTGATKA